MDDSNNEKRITSIQEDPEHDVVIKSQIAQSDENSSSKTIQAASIPAPVKVTVTDWTKYPLYSHTLTSWRYQYLADQMNFYLITIASTVCIGKAFSRSWNIKKAMEILKTKEDFVEIGKFYFHMHNSGVNCENWKGICYFWTIICSF